MLPRVWKLMQSLACVSEVDKWRPTHNWRFERTGASPLVMRSVTPTLSTVVLTAYVCGLAKRAA